MRKQENLDDFLKKNLDDDSLFEYNEADWAKAEKLIANNNATKGAAITARKIIGVSAVIVALIMYVISHSINKNANNIAHGKPNNDKSNIAENTANKDNAVGNNSELDNDNVASVNDSPNKISNKINSANNKTNQVISERNLPNSNIQLNSENSTTTNESAAHETKAKGKTKELKQITKKAIDSESASRLNEIQDYAEIDTKKHWYDFAKISLFNKNKINENNFLQNSRNLIVIKEINTNSTIDLNEQDADFAQNIGTIKTKKPFTFNALVGVGFYKQFTGNMSHSSTPSIDPYAGVEVCFYINKTIGFTSQLLYSQRRGLNNSYINSNQYGDSDFVSLTKIHSIELPLLVSYTLNKSNSCYAGFAPVFYVGNQSSIQSNYTKSSLGKANGVIAFDGAVIFGYRYHFNNRFLIMANTSIGIRDVTKNKVYTPGKRDDNVSLRLGIGYTLFSRE